ncbi:MAG: Crp/Fnr family transcriptional regulator [Pseudomonadales bacterium]|nr:Crp/Fnr family transcriptional regulator [Pseudomonadales bacterium]
MAKGLEEERAFKHLRKVMHSYAPLSDLTWQRLVRHCEFKTIGKKSLLYASGEIPTSFSFVYRGLFRAFNLDPGGSEYNKTFFYEGRFPGSMTALLTQTPTGLSIEALEDSAVIVINFKGFRQLLMASEDLKLFQIHYLEKNWLLRADARDNELVQQDASARYLRFLSDFPQLSQRLAQYHIASHLGITATQLSRIRKKLES